jgi:hypothetical protein
MVIFHSFLYVYQRVFAESFWESLSSTMSSAMIQVSSFWVSVKQHHLVVD